MAKTLVSHSSGTWKCSAAPPGVRGRLTGILPRFRPASAGSGDRVGACALRSETPEQLGADGQPLRRALESRVSIPAGSPRARAEQAIGSLVGVTSGGRRAVPRATGGGPDLN